MSFGPGNATSGTIKSHQESSSCMSDSADTPKSPQPATSSWSTSINVRAATATRSTSLLAQPLRLSSLANQTSLQIMKDTWRINLKKNRMIQNVWNDLKRHMSCWFLLYAQFGSFPGSIQAALGICSLAGHLVSWQIAQTSMPPWPNPALKVPLQMCMRAMHIFPLTECWMLPVIEKYDHITYK